MPRAERAQRFLIDPLAVTRDPIRRSMSPAAQGVYDTLWLESWNEKVPGHLPANERILAGLAQVGADEWRTVADEVRTGFTVTADEWICKAIERSKDEQEEWRTRWRKQKRRQRMREADTARTSPTESSVSTGSGSGTGTGTGSGTEKKTHPYPSAATGPLTLPAIGGKSWTPTAGEVAALREAYPGVPLEPAFAKMRAWLTANPTNGKTARGLPRFANRWLAKDQDRGGHTNGHAPPTTERFVCRERDCRTSFQRPIGSHDELCPDCRARYAK